MTARIRDILEQIRDLASAYGDHDADADDQSPDNQQSHWDGLIWQLAEKALKELEDEHA